MSTPMGRIVKQVSENTTKYYWYPGDKKEWIRAGIALGIGAAAFGILSMLMHDTLVATVVGCSLTLAVAGMNFGRRDARALSGFPDLGDKAARRAAIAHTGRAAWRGMVEGFAGAAAAVIILNLPHRGVLPDWVLPLVPAVVGALAHQAGMLYEQLGQAQARSTAAATPDATAPVLEVAGSK
ncbi:MAG TPA: hypothetical protein VFE14_06635 [Micromonosporaceae bacterium]|nr:hypothetical protein [Micromonosporaceae bacterium]